MRCDVHHMFACIHAYAFAGTTLAHLCAMKNIRQKFDAMHTSCLVTLSSALRTLSHAVLLFGLSAAAHAAGFQSLDSIREAAESQIRALSGDKVGTLLVSTETLDPRLRLAQCPTPLESFLPSGANLGVRATVAVRCSQGTQWTLYVPVNIESETSVLTLLNDTAKDTPLRADHVTVAVRRVPGLRSRYLTEVKQLNNQRLKRSLTAGTILTPEALAPTLLVKRGQEVTLLASMGGIEVRSRGTALGDGSVNSRIQVRNSTTTKVVEGVVDGESLVRVLL